LFFIATAVAAAIPNLASAQYSGVVLYAAQVPAGCQNSGSLTPTINDAAGGQLVGFDPLVPATTDHALLWTASNSTAVDLNPTNLSGYSASSLTGTNGSQQVGVASGTATSVYPHAMLWNGTADSAVDLNPTNLNGFLSSYANCTSGSQQAGYGYDSNDHGRQHALLWNGAANSAVDLNPANLPGFWSSIVYGMSSTQQVGWGETTDMSPYYYHALLWSGNDYTVVDLNPTNLSGFTNSCAYGAGGGQQVGYGYGPATGGSYHALLWSGRANTAVDLNPTNLTGFTTTFAYATNGSQQVGYGEYSDYNDHAMLWDGSGSTAVDLQTLLPSSGAWTSSQAFTIDAGGDVFGYADGTYDGYTGDFAIEWEMPEPASLCFVAFGGLLLCRRVSTIEKRA